MQKLLTTFLLCIILTQSFAQSGPKLSAYLQGQFTKSIYDRTIGNNPWGIGLGVQAFVNSSSKLQPTIDFTADAYLEDDKVLRLNPDDTKVEDINGVVNLFGGASYQPSSKIYLGFVTGPSFINGRTLLGIKPSFGFDLSSTKRWRGKLSYINIFNRYKRTNEDFGSISLSIGLKLF